MYELTYIINPNLSDEEVAAQTDKVRSFINGKGGEIKNERLNEKRRLAYPIKKQGFGFYVTTEFELQPEHIEDTEKQIKLEQNILRHLLIVKEKIIISPRPAQRMPKITESRAATEKPLAPAPKEKIKIEEIDKKLEELLEQ